MEIKAEAGSDFLKEVSERAESRGRCPFLIFLPVCMKLLYLLGFLRTENVSICFLYIESGCVISLE